MISRRALLGAVAAAPVIAVLPAVAPRYEIGVDVARFGSDRTMLSLLERNADGTLHVHRTVSVEAPDLAKVSAVIARVADDYRTRTVLLNASGIGFAVADRLSAHGYDVRRFS